LIVSIVALLLTRRHFKTGRGDRTGAFRTALVVFVAGRRRCCSEPVTTRGLEWNGTAYR
jgi:hypothetical protein